MILLRDQNSLSILTSFVRETQELEQGQSASHCIPHIAGRGNLILRHFALLVDWQKSTPSFASTLERKYGNINLNKYFIC